MSGRLLALLAALALGAACSHTKTTDDGMEKPRKQEPQAKKPAQKQAPPAPGEGIGTELHPGKPDAVPVATGPEALLKPGADDQIRERLVANGVLDGDGKKSAAATRDAIRRFQQAHDLPATGVADHETVKALGLDPDQIFRQATVKD